MSARVPGGRILTTETGWANMATFNWSPGIGDPTFMGWLTVALYFLAALGCWLTVRMLSSPDFAAESTKEVRAWWWIAVTFVALGINKQLDLQTALTETGRALATFQGWYDQRQPVQVAFIALVTIICLMATVVLLRWARHAPAPTWLALIGSVSVIRYVLIRAASFHHIDRFIGAEVLGFRWNWILEIGGISVVLVASYWRRRPTFDQSRTHSARMTDSRGRRFHDFKLGDDKLAPLNGYTPIAPTRTKQPTAQIWLTYAELSELLRCELSDVRQAVIDNEWSERRSSDGRPRAKLSPALAHQFMLNYVAGLGHEVTAAGVVNVWPNSQLAAPGDKCQFAAERRMNRRRRITTEPVIWHSDSFAACTVQDRSPSGVGLTLPDIITLPAEFDLTFDHATHRCVTVWRRLDRMGVKLKLTALAS
jgi:hypothetical protein